MKAAQTHACGSFCRTRQMQVTAAYGEMLYILQEVISFLQQPRSQASDSPKQHAPATLIVAPHACYQHHTCPEPITRATRDCPPENSQRLTVLTDPGASTSLMPTGRQAGSQFAVSAHLKAAVYELEWWQGLSGRFVMMLTDTCLVRCCFWIAGVGWIASICPP